MFLSSVMITTGAICTKVLLMKNKKLRVLNISRNHIGNEGVAAVCEEFRKKNTLTKLQLYVNDCGLSVEGMYRLYCLNKAMAVK